MKELAYILYQDTNTRNIIFAKLGDSVPSNMASYKRYITKQHAGGLLGLFEVIFVYLELRDAGGEQLLHQGVGAI